MALLQIVHYVFLQGRQFLLQKQVQNIFHRLLAELMTVAGMEWN